MTTSILSRKAAAFLKVPCPPVGTGPNGLCTPCGGRGYTTPMLVPCPCLSEPAHRQCPTCYKVRLESHHSDQCTICQGNGTVVRDCTEGEVLEVLAAMGWDTIELAAVNGSWDFAMNGHPFGEYLQFFSTADTPMGALNAACEQAAGEEA